MLRHKRKAPVYTVVIRMLDGSDSEYAIQKSDTPDSVILNIATALNLTDRSIFGLAYPWSEVSDEVEESKENSPYIIGAWNWLNNHKPLLKQISDHPDSVSDAAQVVHFRFKFYPRPPIATSVQDEKIRHLLRQQIEQDFRDGHLDCSFHMRAYMDAYLMQAELGNYDSRLHNSLDYVRVIKNLDARFDGVEMLQWIASYHSELDGLTASEAETKYLSLATRLPNYGVTSFPVSGISGQQLTLNIGMEGIFTSSDMTRAEEYWWRQIISLSYRRRRFRLEIQAQDADESSKLRPNIVEYKCSSERAAKLVWLTSMDFHMFYRPRTMTVGNITSSYKSSSPQNLKGTRNLLRKTASLRRSLSARRHHYSTGHVLRAERRSQSDSLSFEESGGSTAGAGPSGEENEVPWRRFSEPTGPQQPSTSTGAQCRLHHSTDSMKIFGEGSGDGTTGSSTPATGHKFLVPPCEMCGWSSAWTRGVSPQLYSEDSLSLLPRKCEFRIIRLGSAKVGWSIDNEKLCCIPMIGFTSSGRRLYSITDDGREFPLEGWSVREGDRLICNLDVRRRFASWYLNDTLLESRSDLPVTLTRSDAQPTVWDNEGDLEIRLSRGNNGPSLSLLARASPGSGNRPESGSVAASNVRHIQTSGGASSATSSDGLNAMSNSRINSRLSSIERDERIRSASVEPHVRHSGKGGLNEGEEKTHAISTEEEDETQETEDELEAVGTSSVHGDGNTVKDPDRLEKGITKIFLTTRTMPFVETHSTRIPATPSGARTSDEELTCIIPYVKTRRCIFQG